MTPHPHRLAAIATAAALLSCIPVGTAIAAPGSPERPFTVVLPAGGTCTFELKVKGTNSRLLSQATDPVTGVVTTVRLGHRLTFTNVDDPRRKVTFDSDLVTSVATPLAGGTVRIVTDGPVATLLFPGDRSTAPSQPTTPSAFLHEGGTVYLDAPGDAADTLVSAEGPSTDICALLS
jgi:uncharacterized protein YndB with AHSA1/START domain